MRSFSRSDGQQSIFIEIPECYEAIAAGLMKWPAPEQVPDAREEIERSNHFDDLTSLVASGTRNFTAAKYVAMMSTALDHRLTESAKRSYLFSEMRCLLGWRPGGRIRGHNLTTLNVARRKP